MGKRQLMGVGQGIKLAALLLLLIIVAIWLQTFVHEVFGHCLFGTLCGGEAYGFSIGLLGGGGADVAGYWGDHLWTGVLENFSGILVNILMGLLIFVFTNRQPQWSVWALFLSLFIQMSVLTQIGYACVGAYYEIADTGGWSTLVPVVGPYLWLVPFLAAPFAARWLTSPYAWLQQQVLPAVSPFRRVVFASLTLGAAICVFAPLHLAVSTLHWQTFPERAWEREADRVLEQKREAVATQIRTEHPELPEEEVGKQVEAAKVEVKPEEVHIGPWVALAFVGLTMLGGAGSLWREKRVPPAPPVALRWKSLAVPSMAVAAGLAILWWNQNTFALPSFGAGLPRYEKVFTDEVVREDWPDVPFGMDVAAIYYVEREKESGKGRLVRFDTSSGATDVVLSGLKNPYLLSVVGHRVYFWEPDYAVEGEDTLICYDAETSTCAPVFETAEWYRGFAVTRDGRIVAAKDRQLLRLNGNGEEVLGALPEEVEGWIGRLAEAPDGTLIATSQESDKRVVLRFSASGDTCRVIAKDLPPNGRMDIDAAGNIYLATVGFSSLVMIEAGETGQARELRKRDPKSEVHCVAAATPGIVYYSEQKPNGMRLRRINLAGYR